MTLPAVDSDRVASRLSLIRPHLDERAWRLLLGAEAKVLGRGGIKLVAAAGVGHPDTVARGGGEIVWVGGGGGVHRDAGARGVRVWYNDDRLGGGGRGRGGGPPPMAVT